jgi:hypothetical protein
LAPKRHDSFLRQPVPMLFLYLLRDDLRALLLAAFLADFFAAFFEAFLVVFFPAVLPRIDLTRCSAGVCSAQ